MCLQEDIKRLRVLADRAAGVTKDKVAARDALALGRQLAQLDATPEQVMPILSRLRVPCSRETEMEHFCLPKEPSQKPLIRV